MAVSASEAYAGPTWLQRNRMTVTPILFLLPGILFFGLYVIIPIFQSFNISLYRWDGLGEATYIGLANYEELLTDRNFEISLWNNAKWLALYLLAIPMGLFIALFLNQTVARHPYLQIDVLFPFRAEPGRRGPRVLVVLPAA
jgi:multiple sugar transport system permease protein